MPSAPLPSEAFTQVLVNIHHHLGIRSPLLDQFLTHLEQLCSVHDPNRLEESILGIAKLMRDWPAGLYQLNPLFRPHARLEFDVRRSPVNNLVLKIADTSRIVTLDPSHSLRFGMDNLSSSRLRDILTYQTTGDQVYDYLHAISDPAFQDCLAQLAQDALDKPNILENHRKKLLKFLRRPGGIPPSLFLCDPKELNLLTNTNFSDIYTGTLAGRKVIVKWPRRVPKNPLNNSEIIRELILCRQLRHPNIAPFLGASFDEHTSQLGLVTPYMKHGNINEFLSVYPTVERLTLVWQIMRGLEYLHEGFTPSIAHRDIKGANILVNDDLVCCLSDFGLSSIPELSQRSRNLGPIGTYQWMAPEVLEEEAKVDPFKVDIYALGITILEIYTGNPPLAGCGFPALYKARVILKKKPSLPQPCLYPPPDFLWELVEMMWDDVPAKRPSIRIIREGIEDSFDFPRTINTSNNNRDRRLHAGIQNIPIDGEAHREVVRRWAKEQRQRVAPGDRRGRNQRRPYTGV